MAQVDLLFLLVFSSLSAFSTHAINPTTPPSPKTTPTLIPSIRLCRHLSIRFASPSHARHIQSWHSLVALFLLLLPSFLSCSISSRTSLIFFISLSSHLSAGLTCMIIIIPPLSIHHSLCALSSPSWSSKSERLSSIVCFTPASTSSSSLSFSSSYFFSLCLRLISHPNKYCACANERCPFLVPRNRYSLLLGRAIPTVCTSLRCRHGFIPQNFAGGQAPA